MCVHVCACVSMCVGACVRACVCVCICALYIIHWTIMSKASAQSGNIIMSKAFISCYVYTSFQGESRSVASMNRTLSHRHFVHIN